MSRIKVVIARIFASKYFLLSFFVGWFLVFLTLSFFRNASLDENIYISDSVTISNLIQSGEWIGNYGVGMHGFLSKFLLGMVFIVTGPSVFVATLMNIVFGTFSGVIFYKILSKYFNLSKIYSILGITLLFSSYQFLTYIPTFYVDIIALFALLLTLDFVLGKRSKWLIGLSLLLLLDAKEHVFFTVAPAFVIWLGVESYINNKGKWFSWVKELLLNGLKLFLPAFAFLILMFTTSVIPLNIYNANILGLINGGTEPMAYNFEVEQATANRDVATNENIARVMPTISVPPESSILFASIISVINFGLSYIGKILYPRTFSFLTVPFIILIPSFIFAVKYFIKSIKEGEKTKMLLPILLVVFLTIYVIHASVGRYLIPISPIIILFFLMFLSQLSTKEPKMKWILVVTVIFSFAGLYFEYSYMAVKIVIYIILFLVLLLIYFNKNWNKKRFKYLLIILLAIFCGGTSILASLSLGQIKSSLLYGYDRECEKIISLVDDNDTIWINDINWDKLPFLLRGENIAEPEWNWSLKEWVPKKKLLVRNEVFNTFNFYWGNTDDFKEKVYANDINKVVYVQLNELIPVEDLLLQDRLEILSKAEWISLGGIMRMKNKDVYIFLVD